MPDSQISTDEKDKLVAEIRSVMADEVPLVVRVRGGACLYAAHFSVSVLRKHGFDAILQAGSLQWPRVAPEDDDGVSPTHFAYMWDPEGPTSLLAKSRGLMPEIHIWCAIPSTREIVDVVTKDLPADCHSKIGYDWPGELPPDYLWSREAPANVYYIPNPEATRYACARIWKCFEPDYLQRFSRYFRDNSA